MALPSPSYPLERHHLGNGLRVVLAPDKSAPVVGIAVYYDVGFRSEPQGRTGFAHLFEHLMFQGSANVAKTGHFTLVQGAGGTLNGSTRLDYTNYYEVLPSNALELGLFLEADRMRSIALTQDNLDNQVAVVKEEIRVNVLNRPYGGFPWIFLPPLLFSSFANSHNGYGDFAELEQASLADAQAFFDRYYAPGNAVLVVAGDLEPVTAMEMVERQFGDIPPRAVPGRESFAEPPLAGEVRETRVDPLAPSPAVAVGWRVPDPVGDMADYLPYVVLAEVLTDSDASRLQRRLVFDDRIVTSVSAHLGLFGDPFDVRDPTALMLETVHPAETSTDAVLAAVDDELDRLAQEGLHDGELQRTLARMVARHLRSADQVMSRTLDMAVHEQQRERPELVNELPGLLAAVTPDAVRAAAGALRPGSRAVLELVPGGAA